MDKKHLDQLQAETVNFNQLALLKQRKHRERRLAPINRNPNCECLSTSQIQQIRRLRIEGLTIREIAKSLNISRSLILSIEVKL